MKDSLRISFPSHPKYLSVVRLLTAKIAELCGFRGKIIEEIRLAVDEACANVIKHAYKGDTSKEIVLKYTSTEKKFTVILEDRGAKADSRLIKGRDLEEVRPGGLGVHFIHRVFDVFEYDEKRTRGNRLILIKYLGREQ
ncbi:MAG: ATP-binding protein [Thermodesulfovibrionales bacterium]|nr:ATP-binding protein [Thermodesulfovibrionales bacterium]